MSKKRNYFSEDTGIDNEEDLNSESEVEAEIEPTPPPVRRAKPAPVDSPKLDFDQAFRVYKKRNAIAGTWSVEAVKSFAIRKIGKSASLEQWVKVFESY